MPLRLPDKCLGVAKTVPGGDGGQEGVFRVFCSGLACFGVLDGVKFNCTLYICVERYMGVFSTQFPANSMVN